MQNLFSGLKVIDVSSVLAGPSVATFFAELGAEVIKVENPKTGGDVTRTWKLPNESTEANVSAYFSSINYGKKFIWLDISSAEGRADLLHHLNDTDILVCNFKSGDAEKFGLDFKTLNALFPRLIMAHLKGYASDEKRVAYDVVLQAETGFMFMNGTPESGPVKMPVALMDVLAAHQLKEGILCALYQRLQTGKGAYVQCTLEESGLASLVNQATNYLMGNSIPQRQGSLHPNIAPYGETFETKDGELIVLAVGSDKQFEQLCALLEMPVEERFASNQKRVVNRKAMAEEMQRRFLIKTAAEWLSLFIPKNIPAGKVKAMDEVMKNAVAQAMILEENIDGINTRRMKTAVFTISQGS